MIFLVELFIAAVSLSALIALASVLAWLIPVVLVVVVGRQIHRSVQIARFEADVAAGRKKRTKVPRCQECSQTFFPCDDCTEAYKAANPA